MRVGLFGGTFDPIHFGHLRAALEVKEAFALDVCHLIPAAIPPHKNVNAVAVARDRLEMIRLAISDDTEFCVSDVELNRSGPSFTIDTVHHFKSILPQDAECFLILGQDAFLEIDTWKSYRALFDLVSLIVMQRPSAAIDSIRRLKASMQATLDNTVDTAYVYSEPSCGFLHNTLKPVYIHPVTCIDISSTHIRSMLKQGRSVQYLMPRKVIDFIISRGLYR